MPSRPGKPENPRPVAVVRWPGYGAEIWRHDGSRNGFGRDLFEELQAIVKARLGAGVRFAPELREGDWGEGMAFYPD